MVGVGNTGLTLALFNLLVIGLSWTPWLGNAIAYSAGIANSYYWNRRWTFGDRQGLPAGRTVSRFVLVNLGGLLITTAIVRLMEPPVTAWASGSVPEFLAINAVEGLAICVGLVWNFTLMNVWAFPHRQDSDGVR